MSVVTLNHGRKYECLMLGSTTVIFQLYTFVMFQRLLWWTKRGVYYGCHTYWSVFVSSFFFISVTTYSYNGAYEYINLS